MEEGTTALLCDSSNSVFSSPEGDSPPKPRRGSRAPVAAGDDTKPAGKTPKDCEASLSILQQVVGFLRREGMAPRIQQTAQGLVIGLPEVVICAICGGWRVKSCPTCAETSSTEEEV